MNKIFKLLPWGLLLAFTVFYFIERSNGPKPGKSSLNGAVKVDVPLEKEYTDSEGVKHSVFPNGLNTISKNDLKNPDRPKNLFDSTAAKMNIAATELLSVTKISTARKDSLLKAQKVIDVLTKRLAFVYSDKFVSLKYTPPEMADTLAAGTFDFAYNADLTLAQYQKRKWFLGRNRSYIDISSSDPRTTIRGLKQLTIEQETPQFGLRIQGSANYNPQTNTFGIGPAVRVDLGRFSIQGNYIYYPESGRWRPGIIGNYDLIRF